MAEDTGALRAEVAQLRHEVEALRAELARVGEALVGTDRGSNQAGALPAQATFEAPLTPQGNAPALNSSVVWSRFHRQSSSGGTSQLLSLIFEAEGPGAFPWPLYIQLVARGTTGGDAVGAYVRLFNEGAGWGAAYHTDLYHLGSGTSIGGNIELTRTDRSEGLPGGVYGTLPTQPAGRAIGVNIQNTEHSVAHGDQAVNIQGGPGRSWTTAVNIEAGNEGRDGVMVGGTWDHAVHLNGQGGVAIAVDGQYQRGLSLEHNDIYLSSGSRIYLDDAAEVYLCFNEDTRRVELVYGPKGVVAAIDVRGGEAEGPAER